MGSGENNPFVTPLSNRTYNTICFFRRVRHRINTSEFKLVDYISNKFVLQVTCGQQHTVCRAVERDGPAVNAEAQHPLVGSEAGADVYVWGNGTLGQLGLGRVLSTFLYSVGRVLGILHTSNRQARHHKRAPFPHPQ